MRYSIPYGGQHVEFELPEGSVLFEGRMADLPAVDLERAVAEALDAPIGTAPLKELIRGKRKIVFLVEDATRDTPLARIVPVITDYLAQSGIPDDAIRFLTAPGTHRIMTSQEIEDKLGSETVRRFKILQHDATVPEDMTDLGTVNVKSAAGGYAIPVRVNRHAIEADFLIGLGNIVPHSDAGFSGGAKILQPGVCDCATTSATHAAAGFCPDIPLGMVDGNPCREGIEAVAHKVGLSFILNVVKNSKNEVIGVFAGDFIEAHRAGAALSRQSFKVDIPAPADIVVVSSSPADLDYWQAEKGLISAYFAVKQGGIVVFVAPCFEGLAHNHPRFREWLSLPLDEVLKRLRAASPEDTDADMVSAVLAVCNCRARDKARIFFVGEGLTKEDLDALGYVPFASVQEAIDAALFQKNNATVGILPKGGISLPIILP